MTAETDFRIIVIDDNIAIHQDFLKILTRSTLCEIDKLTESLFGHDKTHSDADSHLPQFDISTASQGQEGFEKIKQAIQEERPFSLAFVDIRMPPGWDGIETIKHIWELDKNIQIVICTAYSDYSWEETIEKLGKTDNLLILKKPFDNISVRQLACALTKKWQLLQESQQYVKKLEQEIQARTLSLQKSLSLIKSTFESSSDGIFVVDSEGKIMDYNKKLIQLLNIPLSLIEEKNEEKLFAFLNDKLKESVPTLKRMRSTHTPKDQTGVEILQFNDGRIFECYFQPHYHNQNIIGRIFVFRDITQRANLESALKYQATHDSLTGLANRVSLIEQLQTTLTKASHDKTFFAILFIDFDRFKLINDSLGHDVGDELLQAAAQRFKTLTLSQDILARLGGDEFILVLTRVTDEYAAVDYAKKVLDAFHEPFAIANRNVTLSLSIGISSFPKDGHQANSLLRNADAAMYSAKKNKGHSFQLYTDDLNVKNLEKLDQENELRQALNRKEFFLCYQPQINLVNEKIIGVEALIRWQHPTKGVLLPMDFIPLAEETGLITAIGEWVLREACQQNKAWQKRGFSPMRVAVNITEQQFKSQNMVTLVKDILHETQLKPEYLELELTENVILSTQEIIDAVKEIKKLGVTIAIDDFGTGYSSLSYLHRIPLDRLKIDSSFIQHIQSATDDEVIVRSIISMAKNLNLEVLAEGVETEEQLNFLKKYECGNVQGFYFSKPLSIKELEDILNATSSQSFKDYFQSKKTNES